MLHMPRPEEGFSPRTSDKSAHWEMAGSPCGEGPCRHNHGVPTDPDSHPAGLPADPTNFTTDLVAEELTAHQPPALLVERALVLDRDGGTVRLKPHQGLDALQLLEACAQAVAVLTGARMRRDGAGLSASGMLVGAKGVVVARAALAGEAVEIDTRRVHALGALELHEVVARSVDMAIELARGELKVASTTPGRAETMA